MSQNLIEKYLLENIKDTKNVFVFPTQTAAHLWADRIITISTVTAVAMNRFVAWDTFKGQSIRSKHQDKTSIPSTMRDIFADQIIFENSKEPFLKQLIVPEYAKTSSGFTSWISSILPTLSSWKKYFEKSGVTADEQDLDLLELYRRYSDFLDKFNFFDPAWETPPFEADGHHYFIFFPEILSDYFEYEQILRQSEDITIVEFPSNYEYETPEVKFFANSRIELKNIASKLLELHNDSENPIDWNQIAISVPDMETYGPYLQRELELFEIPHIIRNATPLSSTGAGGLFGQLQNCVSSDFNYDSLKNLLLNSELPWKDKISIKQLIEFGQNNHCICAFDFNGEKIDVWEKSFKEQPQEERAATFYHLLKHLISKLVNAKTFEEIRDFYFEFRSKMFDMSKCSIKSDLILSRCITELSGLLDLEKDYLLSAQPPVQLNSPYSFFVDSISNCNYLEQTEEIGVQILPYKLSATAPFDCQIIIDANQSDISVIYKQLTFLRDDKRKQLLGRDDPNVTQKFIQLYAMNSICKNAYFTASSRTFQGYAQTCSYLKEINLCKVSDEKQLFGNNPYLQEKRWILNWNEQEFPEKITETQKNSADFWINNQNFNDSEDFSEESVKPILDKIHSSKIRISNTQLKTWNFCPRAWIFEKRLSLNEESNAAVLMDYFQMGSLYHSVFEVFCQKLKEKNLPIYSENNELTDSYKTILEESIMDAINSNENPYITKQLLLTTKNAIDKTIVSAITGFCNTFKGCLVVDNEISMKYENVEKGYQCNGKFDCLLKYPGSGETLLIDFKSTDNGVPKILYADPENPKELPDYQIPMYVYTLRNCEKPIQIDNACFFNIKDTECQYVFGEELAETLEIPEDYIMTSENFEPTIQSLVENMESMVNRINTNDFEIDPKIQNFNYCAGCAYKIICRKNLNVGKRD